MSADVPKIIWTLWLQGFDQAPPVVRAAVKSWRRLNPGWRVHMLDRQTLDNFIPAADLARIFDTEKESEALSDQIRLELLHRYGGVWADATALCVTPLDQWLPAHMQSGFFAFERPGPDRMLSSWFLAAEKGSYIVEQWREAANDYWEDRAARDQYFWVHRLFEQCWREDEHFQRLWEATPKLPAFHPYHFGPGSERLLGETTEQDRAAFEAPPSPVFKLTHKIDAAPEGSLLNALIRAQDGPEPPAPASRRLLVCWYGSFPGHGTIGDLLSLHSVVSHLVGRGHAVSHCTAADVQIPGADRVDDASIDRADHDAMIFVCGPILKFHPQSNALFARFDADRMIGVGVSLLPA
ncbi:MAG: capsular polysaccharide synthesis protein, partial [Alphaproteobacteria bacterium]